MGVKYEIHLSVDVSFENPNDALDALEYFADKLYDDPSHKYHVNCVSQIGGTTAYDTETGEDL